MCVTISVCAYVCAYVCNRVTWFRFRYIWPMEYYNTSITQISVYIHGSSQSTRNGVLELAHISSRELTVSITSQFHIHIRTQKLAMLGALTPGKSANATNQGSPTPDCWLLNICQHTTSFKSPFGK